jgi:anti-anti-sigma factor
MEALVLSAPDPSFALNGAGRVPRIEVDMDARPRGVFVRLAGEADVRQVGELTAALLPLSACRPTLVILDLSRLTEISCLAIGVLAEFRRGVARAGGRVRLADPLPESVREALNRAELLSRFEVPQDAERREAAAPEITEILCPCTTTKEV